jgi:hypothetical protein
VNVAEHPAFGAIGIVDNRCHCAIAWITSVRMIGLRMIVLFPGGDFAAQRLLEKVVYPVRWRRG